MTTADLYIYNVNLKNDLNEDDMQKVQNPIKEPGTKSKVDPKLLQN